MAEYSIGFAKNLLSAAKNLNLENQNSIESERAVLYLSLLASEVLLKCILERVGISILELKSISHDIPKLLNKVCECEIFDSSLGFTLAVILRSKTFNANGVQYTLGQVLSLGDELISKYPNQLRYGEQLCHFPSFAVLNATEELYKFTVKYKDNLYIKRSNKSKVEIDVSYKTISNETKNALAELLKKIGGGIKIGDEIDFLNDETIRDLDFWIGYTIKNYRDELAGEIISGYVYLDKFNIYTEINIDYETIESDSISIEIAEKIKMKVGKDEIYKFKELEIQMINTINRANKRYK